VCLTSPGFRKNAIGFQCLKLHLAEAVCTLMLRAMEMRPIAMGAIWVVVITVTSAQTTSIAQSASVVVEANSPVLRRTQLTEAIGLETLGGVLTPILKAGCALPCEVTSTFTTAPDKQTEIKISLFRGSGGLASENYSLGSFAILGIPPIATGETTY
jgi:molecular chaperone DnaK (HSP70)